MGYSLDEIDPVVSLKQIVTDCTGILVRSLVTATRRRPMRLHVGKTRGGGGGGCEEKSNARGGRRYCELNARSPCDKRVISDYTTFLAFQFQVYAQTWSRTTIPIL